MPTFHFVHGKANVVADALSRHIATISQIFTSVNLTQPCIAAVQQSDLLWKHVIYFLTSGDTTNTDDFPPNIKNYTLIDEVLYHNTTLNNKHEPDHSVLQLIVPTEFIPEVLNLVHNSSIMGHPGKDKCLTQAMLQYFWLSMWTDIQAHIDACHSVLHTSHISGHVPILMYPAPCKPFELLNL
ncbi:uncharacterized protein LOC143018979 [Oratosquilla oratoria]|uniref:uncharacterized protein LOC143018979 n=1 Tax=Oratosquilla oratoria TaxID=337810 RepID=UPI003F75AE6A